MAHRIQLPELVSKGWRGHYIAGIGLDNQVYLIARSYGHTPPKVAIFRGSRYVPKSWSKIVEIEVVDEMLLNDFNDYFFAALSNDDKYMAVISHGELVDPKFHLIHLNSSEGMSFVLFGRKGSSILIETVLGWASCEYCLLYSIDSDPRSIHRFYRIVPEVQQSVTMATAEKCKDITMTYRFLFAYNFKQQLKVFDMLNVGAEWRVFDMYSAPATNLHIMGNDLLSLRAIWKGYQISQVIFDTDPDRYRLESKGFFVRPGFPHLLNEQNWFGITTDEHHLANNRRDAGVFSYVRLSTISHWKPFTLKLKELCTMKIQKITGIQVQSKSANIAWTNGVSAEDLKFLLNYKLEQPFA